MARKVLAVLVFMLLTGMVFAGSVSLSYKGFSLSYSWSSDKSLADDDQVRQAVQQGFGEGVEDGLKDKNNSSTTHYGDSYSRHSYSNSYVRERYHDAYMEGYKKGAGKPPSISDSIYW
jgi:hypothetical protein